MSQSARDNRRRGTVNLRLSPSLIVVPRRCERRERVDLGERRQPVADAATGHPAPPVQREVNVEVPERQRLNGKVQQRRGRPELAEPQGPAEPAHPRRRIQFVHQQAGLKPPQRVPFEPRARGVRQQRRITVETFLTRPCPFQRPLQRTAHRERQHHAGEHRHHPPAGRGIDEEEQPDRRQQEGDRGLQEHVCVRRVLGPAQERVEIAVARRPRQHAVGGELLAPFDHRGQLGDRGLPLGDRRRPGW